MSRLLCVLFFSLCLSGCSWLWSDGYSGDGEQPEASESANFDDSDSEFDDSDEDEEAESEPKDLESIDATIKIKKIWRKSIGSSEEVYQPTCGVRISTYHLPVVWVLVPVLLLWVRQRVSLSRLMRRQVKSGGE